MSVYEELTEVFCLVAGTQARITNYDGLLTSAINGKLVILRLIWLLFG